MKIMTYRSAYEIQGKFHFYSSEEQLRKEWKHKARGNIKHATFLEGILLKSLDKDNPYPYVDYAVFCSGLAINHNDHIPASTPPNHHRNAKLRAYHKLHQPPQAGSARLDGSGFYDELEYILRHDVKPLPRTPVSKDSVYFVSAFRTDGHLQSLEDTWKTWSGADYVLWKCPVQLKLRRVTFLKATCDLDPYTFLVLCECEEGLNTCNTAREFVERLKERRCGLVGLYQVERYYISSKTKT